MRVGPELFGQVQDRRTKLHLLPIKFGLNPGPVAATKSPQSLNGFVKPICGGFNHELNRKQRN
jgi:hypothetical protein